MSDRNPSAPNPNTDPAVDEVVRQALQDDVPRRDFLRRLVVAGLSSAAAYQVLDETTASAQSGGSGRITTFAIGEEGTAPHPPSEKPSPNPPMTTKAVGEESQRPPTKQITTGAIGEESTKPPSQQITTHAVGEETTRPPNRQITTYAVGEESSKPPTTLSYGLGEESPRATTLAVGEEGKPAPRPTPKPTTTSRSGEESKMTTFAVGEESGGTPKPSTRAWGEEGSIKRPQFNAPSGPFQNIPRPWKNFRRW
ncbi:hypothetical protein [Stieleria mannarensis]|uniref:hypothetical protein n=1 Tax=Stieleria mannarensis TaxID=2755585 RepID=UPI001600E59F|nr:hypothetical protein [Rhodopirellula sp. JC639]